MHGEPLKGEAFLGLLVDGLPLPFGGLEEEADPLHLRVLPMVHGVNQAQVSRVDGDDGLLVQLPGGTVGKGPGAAGAEAAARGWR